ncbi:GAF and ANTAR domain-containing protein [Streptomyces sp. NPDC046465]|uniref:GAF and ANTAR domain-containing protein n=1 Tax=Streptomyces sp. NPDC046465 TaxID=3155810 RepID=UPI0033EC5ADA
MTAHRAMAAELAALHLDHPDPASSLTRACRAALGPSWSAGLTLAADAALAQRVSLAADGPLASQGEALQINLGEGPCVEALSRRRPVLAPDLDDHDATGNWPVYAAEARAHGIRAAFALPVAVPRHSSPQPGLVLSLYRDRPGVLSDGDLHTARAHADAAELLLLSVPAPGEDDAAEAWLLPADAVVHQATGMISYRHGLTAGQALALLRAHAHTRHTDLAEVARNIVHEGLRLPDLPQFPES